MPGIAHEAPLELLHGNPLLAVALAAAGGITVPAGASAWMADSNLTSRLPTELRADAVTVISGDGGKLVVVTEVQQEPPSPSKQRAWPAYLALARVEHKCPAVLIVIAADRGVARSCARPIATGHPGFDLVPVVIGPDTTPPPAAMAAVTSELTVLGVLTRSLDLDDPETQMTVLADLARLDADRRATYTRLVHIAASASARRALEELMTTVFRDEFVDGLLDQGKAEGRAEMILRVLAARGLRVPAPLRDQVLACTDASQLAAWGDRAATATTLDQVFGR